MQVFFTGCTHFGHANILNLASRPFGTVEEMDEAMIQNWNETVKQGDAVHHLGDFAWKDHDKYLKRLNGTVFRYQGNHDPFGWGRPYGELEGFGRKIVLMHYPIEEWNGWYRNAIHLHCHTHKTELASAPRRFNVGVDATGFRPISVEEIVAHPNTRAALVIGRLLPRSRTDTSSSSTG